MVFIFSCHCRFAAIAATFGKALKHTMLRSLVPYSRHTQRLSSSPNRMRSPMRRWVPIALNLVLYIFRDQFYSTCFLLAVGSQSAGSTGRAAQKGMWLCVGQRRFQWRHQGVHQQDEAEAQQSTLHGHCGLVYR